jgi:hypothetical protein
MGERGLAVIEDFEASCRDFMSAEKLFTEDLAAFELGASSSGSEDQEAFAFEEIDDAGNQWSLGAYDGQIDRFSLGEPKQSIEILAANINALGFLGDARVTGRAVDLRL